MMRIDNSTLFICSYWVKMSMRLEEALCIRFIFAKSPQLIICMISKEFCCFHFADQFQIDSFSSSVKYCSRVCCFIRLMLKFVVTLFAFLWSFWSSCLCLRELCKCLVVYLKHDYWISCSIKSWLYWVMPWLRFFYMNCLKMCRINQCQKEA